MKQQSKVLADNFKSGDTRPILEAMDNEYEKLGLSDNNIISVAKFAAYKIGQWVSLFNRNSDNYGYIDSYMRKDKDNPKEYSWERTLTNPQFASQMVSLLERDRNMYAEFILMEEKYIDSPLFLVGLMNVWKENERKRMGERIKNLREEIGLTQEQLAEKTGLQKQNISRIELGKYSTGQDILSVIAAALGKRLDII